MDNKQTLNFIKDRLSEIRTDSLFKLRKISVIGAASPEGSISINRRLSEKRADVLMEYISGFYNIPEVIKSHNFIGRDWTRLISLVKDDKSLPYYSETMNLLNDIVENRHASKSSDIDDVIRLRRLRNGIPYKYMYEKYFPELRASRLYLHYEKVELPKNDTIWLMQRDTIYIKEKVYQTDTVLVKPECNPFYAALKTNMLYDALLIPNMSADIYMGKNLSLSFGWMYAWWNKDSAYRYWRTYGGDLEVRYWFGRKAKNKPLTGHHIGLYGQLVTYDLELGGRGYLGDRWSYGGGLSYGYSMPVSKRLNIDFSLGIGYIGGEYKEYLPENDCYVWQITKQRNWIGLTKAEVSLVWLLGCRNFNIMKGKK